MAAPLYPGTNQYTGITISGLYDNNTGAPLFAANGTAAGLSSLTNGGVDPNGLQQAIHLDQSASQLIFPGIQFFTGAAWNSGTSAGTFQYNTGTATPLTTLSGAPAYLIQLDQTTTLTGGAVTFQGTYDNINWVTIATSQILDPTTFAAQTNPYTFQASTNKAFLVLAQGFAAIRLDLSTAITGTGSVTPYWSTLAYEPSILSTTSSTVSGTLTNNNAAPIGNNVGVLPAIAETAYNTITYTTGNQVLPVTDLHGALNQDLQAVAGVQLGATAVTAFGTAPAAVNVPAVNSSIYAGTTGITATGSSLNTNVTNTVTVTGTVAVTQSTSPWVVSGNLTNNNAAPAANNVGVLGFIAETAYNTVTYTTGDQVLAVTDLHGAVNGDVQAVAGVQLGATAVTAFGTAPAAVNVPAVNSSIFAGTTALTATGSSLNVNVTGSSTLTVAGNLTNNNAAPTNNNVGVLPAIAVSGAFPAVTIQATTAGDQELLTVSQGGSLITIPADEQYASHIGYFADDSGFTTLITLANATLVPLISIQSNSAAISFLIREVTGYGDGSQAKFVLIKNPQTLTGAAFTATGIPTGSHIKRDTTATAVTIGTGTVVWSSMAASAPAHTDQLLVSLAAGAPGDTYTLAAQKFGTGTSKAFGSIRWSEEAAAI